MNALTSCGHRLTTPAISMILELRNAHGEKTFADVTLGWRGPAIELLAGEHLVAIDRNPDNRTYRLKLLERGFVLADAILAVQMPVRSSKWVMPEEADGNA